VDSTPNQLCEALTETTLTRAVPAKPKRIASVRTSPGGYFATAAILTFVSLILLRTHHDLAALALTTGTWTITPLLLLTDRLHFDGETLSRTGLVAIASRLLRAGGQQSTVSDIERVDVATLRTVRRAGSVRYRYRIEIAARDHSFAFSSGGANFRQMARSLLPLVADFKLDARALELRDHLRESKSVRAEARRLGIASASVLEQTAERTRNRIEKQRREAPDCETSLNEVERATVLRQSANELRIAGRLRQSGEAFRRALLISPREPWLIYEYARLLRSQASAFADARLLGRACAALRLAANRGRDDARLLERIAETFLEYADPVRAAKTFRAALELDQNAFRAQVGLAEVALIDGKLAHVIHHYNEAVRIAPDKAAARLVRREANYYTSLNNDEDYLAAELRRMNWLEGTNRVQRLAARVTFAALLIALVGPSINQVLAGLGWALASSSIIAWTGSLITKKFLSGRGRIAVGDL
jgi:tetratricopeptide (TPR) repeat protein